MVRSNLPRIRARVRSGCGASETRRVSSFAQLLNSRLRSLSFLFLNKNNNSNPQHHKGKQRQQQRSLQCCSCCTHRAASNRVVLRVGSRTRIGAELTQLAEVARCVESDKRTEEREREQRGGFADLMRAQQALLPSSLLRCRDHRVISPRLLIVRDVVLYSSELAALQRPQIALDRAE